MLSPEPYRVVARNTATESENRIHADDVARAYGFAGGLVPGVTVFAYLCHPPAAEWGLEWLRRGAIAARFSRPVYDAQEVTVEREPAGAALALSLRGPDGGVCASATAGVPESAGVSALAGVPPPDLGRFAGGPSGPPPAGRRPPADSVSLAPGRVLGPLDHGFHADRAAAYLEMVGETLPLFAEEGVAHPGWLLLSVNAVLAANVALGPWIHVSSDVTFHRLVSDGASLRTHALVADRFERKGHHFVTLDVVVTADGLPAMSVVHTAIYRPRPSEN